MGGILSHNVHYVTKCVSIITNRFSYVNRMAAQRWKSRLKQAIETLVCCYMLTSIWSKTNRRIHRCGPDEAGSIRHHWHHRKMHCQQYRRHRQCTYRRYRPATTTNWHRLVQTNEFNMIWSGGKKKKKLYKTTTELNRRSREKERETNPIHIYEANEKPKRLAVDGMMSVFLYFLCCFLRILRSLSKCNKRPLPLHSSCVPISGTHTQLHRNIIYIY